MINLDEEALICDLAETYNIYDYEQLPLYKVAVFSVGLKDDSRIKMKMSNVKVSLEQTLLMGMLDRLSLLVYSKTKDASKGINKPLMLSDKIFNNVETQGFDSSKDFEKRRKEILEGLNG